NATIRTPLTDEGMEIALDMVEDQALAALFGDPQSDWAELLKGLVMNVNRITGQRGASSERDRRWAARQLGIMCDTQSDIGYGCEIPYNHPIQKFIKVSHDNPGAGMEHVAEICQALIDRKVAPKWEQTQAILGVRRLGLRAIGLAPLSSDLITMATDYGEDLTDEHGEAPILRKVSAYDTDQPDDPKHGAINHVEIETNVATIKPTEKQDVF